MEYVLQSFCGQVEKRGVHGRSRERCPGLAGASPARVPLGTLTAGLLDITTCIQAILVLRMVHAGVRSPQAAPQTNAWPCASADTHPNPPPGARAGFISAPSATELHFDLSEAAVCGAAAADFTVGAHVGVLGLEHETRRRNRANGVVSHSTAAGIPAAQHSTARPGAAFTIAVQQSFGNCPKYIQKRDVGFDAAAAAGAPRDVPAAEVTEGALNDAMAAIVEQAGRRHTLHRLIDGRRSTAARGAHMRGRLWCMCSQ